MKPRRVILGLAATAMLAPVTALADEPAAIVENTSSKTADLSLFQYLKPGARFELAAGDRVVLGYLRSCVHETITGGRVLVGTERSKVSGGQVKRTRVECDTGTVDIPSNLAAKSGVTVFRTPPKSAASSPASQQPKPSVTIYSTRPVVTAAQSATSVSFRRLDGPGSVTDLLLKNGHGDMANAAKPLVPGGIYSATADSRRVIFKVDPLANGNGPVVGRLLRF